MAEKQPCSFNCGNKYEIKSLKKHENACLHRPYECPFVFTRTCYWKGIKKDIFEHLRKHEEADFSNILIKTSTNGKYIKFARISDKIFVLQILIDGCSPRKKFWFKLINIVDSFNVCQLQYNIVVMKNSQFEKTNIQVKMCDINIADDLTWELNMSEMHIFDLYELTHTIDCATTEIVCKFEIFDKSVCLYDHKRHLTQLDVLFELECPVCKEYMIFKIFVCAGGHSFCGECRNNLKSCPICRQVLYNPPRNITLETIAQHLTYPCRGEDCDFIGNAVEIQEHEKHCFTNIK